jgi:eukaryotic-like serine/threonine-protein kinase
VGQELVAGRYRLDERLAVGGMAEVWAAEDVELGRRVAVKLLGSDADPARFEREARAVAAVAHPNICQVYDYGEEGGRPFMVLEYLGGGTLEDRLVPGKPYPDDETGRIAREIASGLAHAHARGLVHRDLKPANVLFDDEGRAKIADFGIARMGGAGTLTEAGTLLGTAAYISPEQAQGLPASAASDVYSFGVILYRLLAGRLPFEAESPLELAAMHVREQPRPLAEVRPDAPPALAAVAEAALAKDPGARPPDGAAVVAALRGGAPTISDAPTLVGDAGPTQVMRPAPGAPPPPGRRSGALPFLIGALLALAAGGAALAVVLTHSSNGSNPQPTPPPPAPESSQRRATTATRPHASSTAPTTTARTSTARTTTARTTTGGSTRHTTTRVTTVTPPPPPPPTPPPTPPPPPPTTLPTTVSVPVTTTPLPPPPPAAGP